jgi:hypothetical protein
MNLVVNISAYIFNHGENRGKTRGNLCGTYLVVIWWFFAVPILLKNVTF